MSNAHAPLSLQIVWLWLGVGGFGVHVCVLMWYTQTHTYCYVYACVCMFIGAAVLLAACYVNLDRLFDYCWLLTAGTHTHTYTEVVAGSSVAVVDSGGGGVYISVRVCVGSFAGWLASWLTFSCNGRDYFSWSRPKVDHNFQIFNTEIITRLQSGIR